MSEFKELTVLLVELYVAIGLMAVGFGVMVAGKSGASRVARAYLLAPVRWAVWRLRLFLRATWMFAWGVLMFWILRPLAYRIWLGLQWLFTRKAGWLRPW